MPFLGLVVTPCPDGGAAKGGPDDMSLGWCCGARVCYLRAGSAVGALDQRLAAPTWRNLTDLDRVSRVDVEFLRVHEMLGW